MKKIAFITYKNYMDYDSEVIIPETITEWQEVDDVQYYDILHYAQSWYDPKRTSRILVITQPEPKITTELILKFVEEKKKQIEIDIEKAKAQKAKRILKKKQNKEETEKILLKSLAKKHLNKDIDIS